MHQRLTRVGIATAAVIAFSVLITPAAQGARDAKPTRLFLWKATSKENTVVYLLGSIHVGDKDFYPLPDEVERAYAESKDLVVEVDMTKLGAGGAPGALVTKGSYEDGSSIGDHVPKPMLQTLRKYFQSRSVPPEAMEHLRPWTLSVVITQLEVEALGLAASLGVDKHFMDKGDGRRVVELESAEEQIGLLSGMPDEMQVAFLASTLDSVGQAKELMAKTVALWKAGDAAGMEKLLIADPVKQRPELKGVFKKLIDQRNEAMTFKIMTLEGEGPHFVVVGAGHLIGANSIVKQLEQKGYRVEQVSRGAKPEVAKAPEKQKPPESTKPAEPERKAPSKKGYAPAGSFDK